jgi:hypothetical protein
LDFQLCTKSSIDNTIVNRDRYNNIPVGFSVANIRNIVFERVF